MILERNDVRIPPAERRDTQTATAVLFFGTAEFSWIDASRNLSPWQTEKTARSDKDDSVDFELVRCSTPRIIFADARTVQARTGFAGAASARYVSKLSHFELFSDLSATHL